MNSPLIMSYGSKVMAKVRFFCHRVRQTDRVTDLTKTRCPWIPFWGHKNDQGKRLKMAHRQEILSWSLKYIFFSPNFVQCGKKIEGGGKSKDLIPIFDTSTSLAFNNSKIVSLIMVTTKLHATISILKMSVFLITPSPKFFSSFFFFYKYWCHIVTTRGQTEFSISGSC